MAGGQRRPCAVSVGHASSWRLRRGLVVVVWVGCRQGHERRPLEALDEATQPRLDKAAPDTRVRETRPAGHHVRARISLGAWTHGSRPDQHVHRVPARQRLRRRRGHDHLQIRLVAVEKVGLAKQIGPFRRPGIDRTHNLVGCHAQPPDIPHAARGPSSNAAGVSRKHTRSSSSIPSRGGPFLLAGLRTFANLFHHRRVRGHRDVVRRVHRWVRGRDDGHNVAPVRRVPLCAPGRRPLGARCEALSANHGRREGLARRTPRNGPTYPWIPDGEAQGAVLNFLENDGIGPFPV